MTASSRLDLDCIRLILTQINGPAERRSVGRSVSLVCRALHEDGQRMMWHTLEPHRRDPDQLQAIAATIAHDERVAGFVREVSWRSTDDANGYDAGYEAETTPRRCFYHVLARCPRLVAVSVINLPRWNHPFLHAALSNAPARVHIRNLDLEDYGDAVWADSLACEEGEGEGHALRTCGLLSTLPSLRTLHSRLRFPVNPHSPLRPIFRAPRLPPLHTLSLFIPTRATGADYDLASDPFLPLVLAGTDRAALRDLALPHYPRMRNPAAAATVDPHPHAVLDFLPHLALTRLHLGAYSRLATYDLPGRAVSAGELPPGFLLEDLAPILPTLPMLQHLTLTLPAPFIDPTAEADTRETLALFLEALPPALKTLEMDYLLTPKSPGLAGYLTTPAAEPLKTLRFVAPAQEGEEGVDARYRRWKWSAEGTWVERA
ncbi:hypothetical protein JCM10207_009257 [Rhodosporidiobolus poonsookiae]